MVMQLRTANWIRTNRHLLFRSTPLLTPPSPLGNSPLRLRGLCSINIIPTYGRPLFKYAVGEINPGIPGDNQAWPPTTHKYTQVSSDKNKRGGDVSIKEKREKEKESQEKRKEKITKKRLKRNGGIEGRSSSELES